MKCKNTLDITDEHEVGARDDEQQDGGTDPATAPQSGVSRRRFLFGGAGAAVAMAAGPAVVTAQQKSPSGQARTRRRVAATTPSRASVQFREPKPVSSQNGKLTMTLDAQWSSWPFSCTGTPPTAQIPTYNGQVTGPTLYINPGDQMSITLNNQLTTNPFTGDHCESNMHITPHPYPGCFTHTNLHTHGLLVSPSSALNTTPPTNHCIDQGVCGPIDSTMVSCASDDVLVDIAPGGSVMYQIDVPSFHDSGTYWYHSHLHGASGYQVSSGMAGAIIIREPVGKELVPPERDSVFLMQEVISGTINGQSVQGTFPAVYGGIVSGGGRPPTFFYINGQCQPTLQISAGRIYRWRFINATATPQGLMKLRLLQCSTDPNARQNCPPPSTALNQSAPRGPTIPMNLIAVDGMAFYGFAPQPVQAHLMAPGNRADFLIKLRPGRYVLYKDAFPQDATCITSTNTVMASANSKQVLAYIIVEPSSYDDQLPNTIPGTGPFYRQPIANVDTVRATAVTFNNPGNAPGVFQIGQEFYKPETITIEAKLNTAEEWILDNSTGFNTHPFHIHLNPFQVKGRTIDFETANPTLDSNNPCNWMWMDTVALPMPVSGTPDAACQKLINNQGSAGGQLKMRTRYLVYPGEYVIHCHILIHEDVGMMANVKINDDGTGIGPCVPLSQPTANAVECVQRTTKPC
jgi:FtsP/CotA-like multicopper oxidase with cupredoxin domain